MSSVKKYMPSALCAMFLMFGVVSILLAGNLGAINLKNVQNSSIYNPNYIPTFEINFFTGAFSPFATVLDIGGIEAWICAINVFLVPLSSIFLLRKNGNLTEPLIVLICPALTASMLATNTWTNIAAGIGGVLSPIVLGTMLVLFFLGQAKKGIKKELGIDTKKS